MALFRHRNVPMLKPSIVMKPFLLVGIKNMSLIDWYVGSKWPLIPFKAGLRWCVCRVALLMAAYTYPHQFKPEMKRFRCQILTSHQHISAYSGAKLELLFTHTDTQTHTQIISTLPVVVSIICSIAPGLEWQVDVVCGDLVSLNHRSSAETWGGLKNKSGRQGTEEIFQNKISTLSSGERCIKML